MTNDNFKHIDPDKFQGKELSLHDCVADKIYLEDGALYFCLPDGFWITHHHKENNYGKIIRTGASVVTFTVKEIENVTVRVFNRNKWFLSRKTYVENWHIKQLIEAINNKSCTLEFITQYRSNYEQMWDCAIHSKKKPYYRECHLYLPETEATFLWNDLRPDCEW